jgi:hypothetical protein
MLSPTERRLRGRIGGLRVHALNDSAAIAARARTGQTEALNARLLAEIDPAGQLAPEERERRLSFARRAHYAGLALKSATTRTKKASTAATTADAQEVRDASHATPTRAS